MTQNLKSSHCFIVTVSYLTMSHDSHVNVNDVKKLKIKWFVSTWHDFSIKIYE